MPLLAQRPAKKMSAAAGFRANQPYMQIRGEVQQLFARTLLPHHRLTNRVETYQVKYRLPKIDANRVNLHRTASLLFTSHIHPKGSGRRTMPLVMKPDPFDGHSAIESMASGPDVLREDGDRMPG